MKVNVDREKERSCSMPGRIDVNFLYEEILFLREELKSKSKIIEILLQDLKSHKEDKTPSQNSRDKVVETENVNDDEFIIPKRTTSNKGTSSPSNEFYSHNKFDALYVDENDNYETEINECNNKNITSRRKRKKLKAKHLKINKSVGNQSENLNERSTPNLIKQAPEKKVVSILGDSIMKEINGYQLSTDDQRVIVKSFPGATTNCMEHYVKPTLAHKPNIIVIHCGTNDLKKDVEPLSIATNIIRLIENANYQCPETQFLISSLIPRNDRYNQKAIDVNNDLLRMCNERNIGFIDHSNLDRRAHLNRSRIHPNRRGTKIIENNILSAIKN